MGLTSNMALNRGEHVTRFQRVKGKSARNGRVSICALMAKRAATMKHATLPQLMLLILRYMAAQVSMMQRAC
jgi:hypothetical protein